MGGHRLDLERPQQHRQDERRGREAVVDDQPEAARADRLDVERVEQVLHVPLGRPGGKRDLSDLVPRRATELLACEVLLDLLDELRRRSDPGRLEDADLEDLRVGCARLNVHPRVVALALQEMPVDGCRDHAEVGGMDARRVHPGEQRAANQPAEADAARLVTTRSPRSSAVPSAIPSRTAVSGRQIDVDAPCDPVACRRGVADGATPR